MQRSVTSRTLGPCDPRGCRSSYKYVHCQEQASRGQSNLAVMAKGYPELEDKFHFTAENVCFSKQGHEVNPHKEKSKSCATLCRISPTSLNSDISKGKSTLSCATCA